MSGWQDSNLRPPAPKAGALTGLRYTPRMAERGGFEPPVPLRVRQFSKLVVSATHPPLRGKDSMNFLYPSFFECAKIVISFVMANLFEK